MGLIKLDFLNCYKCQYCAVTSVRNPLASHSILILSYNFNKYPRNLIGPVDFQSFIRETDILTLAIIVMNGPCIKQVLMRTSDLSFPCIDVMFYFFTFTCDYNLIIIQQFLNQGFFEMFSCLLHLLRRLNRSYCSLAFYILICHCLYSSPSLLFRDLYSP